MGEQVNSQKVFKACVCVHVCDACHTVCAVCVLCEPEEGVGSLGVKALWATQCEWWDWNSGPVQEQCVLLCYT